MACVSPGTWTTPLQGSEQRLLQAGGFQATVKRRLAAGFLNAPWAPQSRRGEH